MKYQRGFSLSNLMVWGIIFALVAVGAMKVAPSAIEYYKIQKNIKAVAASVPPDATVSQVKSSFSKYAEVDHLKFSADDLEITKDSGQVVISFAYEKKIPLFGNVSLLIDYKGSTAPSGKT